eukprot:6775514-Prymnesium_polylepis.1
MLQDAIIRRRGALVVGREVRCGERGDSRGLTRTRGGVPPSPLESFLFRQVGSGAARSPFVPVLGRVKVSEAATLTAAWRRPLSMPPPRSHALVGQAVEPH